ncbi:ADP-L-glycero-D-manno-heptose-6-epimerase [Paenibacillus plantiphilus]|uniref:ADP-L-glycero-D-manno-heptose-6-epimerase n=1 Tax=Paenibacillus plantiphilus TaxID=2905650 RepID=A0ABN8GU68_9BACL|nr:NAD-dependent epimerase/dehydratase family protein [Paenibacillus plantiphilus]CAH1218383.1 ADP-L-glycero-D-manno-heptose-6-epimerase [Paenibacillus plantiphilus]
MTASAAISRDSRRTAIVTGATGFIGAALCRQLLQKGWRVYAIIRPQSPHCGRLPKHNGLIRIEGDLSTIEAWGAALLEAGVHFTAFFHLAWNGVGRDMRNDATQQHNIAPAVDTVHLARRLNCSVWIGAGSQAEYGRLEGRVTEKFEARPTTAYGLAKLTAGQEALALSASMGLPAYWMRIFSTYGPGDNEGWLIGDCIRQLLRGERPPLTKGEQRWDYLYVDDAAAALLSVAEQSGEHAPGVYNLGSGQSRTIRHIVSLIRDETDKGIKLKFGELPYREDQVMHLEADISPLAALTGWRPRTTLRQGIALTVKAERERFAAERRLAVKRSIVTMAYEAGVSHVGAALSVADIVHTLYAHIMRVDPAKSDWPERDKLVFSKAHGSSALYAVLADQGFFPQHYLSQYCVDGGVLPGHLDRTSAPGIDVSAGSLGHGLPIAVGMALAERTAGRPGRVFAILGDGECNEGAVWEAAMLASSLSLGNLTVIVDCNGLQGFDTTEKLMPQSSLAAKWQAFGWETVELDGHDPALMIEALQTPSCKPSVILALTIKGCGVDFMEDRLEWHYKSPSREQWESAMRQLGGIT